MMPQPKRPPTKALHLQQHRAIVSEIYLKNISSRIMKFPYILSFVTCMATVEAGVPKPEILIGINVGEGSSGTLGGIEPRILWSNSGTVAGVNVEGGVDMLVSDVDVPPQTNLWGKLKKTLPFGDVSIRGDVNANAPEVVDVDLRATVYGTSLQLLGSAGPKDVALEKVVMTKDFSALGGTWAVSPKYKVGGDADVSVGYVVDNTAIKVDTAGKTLTVAHSFSQGTDTIAPTINLAGDVSLSYTRQLDKGQIKTTYTPDDSVSVQWSDGVYETTFKAPLEGYYKTNSGIKINMKRTVEL